MIKGKLSVSRENEKRLVVKVINVEMEGKSYFVYFNDFIISELELESYNDKDVQYEIKAGKVEIIYMDKRRIYDTNRNAFRNEKKDKKDRKNQKKSDGQIQSSAAATAPYNFIPLNKQFVPSPLSPEGGFIDMDRYYSDRNSGYIDITVTNRTPLYIRSVSKMGSESEYINPLFFSPAQVCSIPGSSLRGAIRNIFEIVTFGRFGFAENKTFYYRTIASKSKKLRSSYGCKMTDRDASGNTGRYKMKAGLLYKKGRDYYIKTTEFKPIEIKDSAKKIIEACHGEIRKSQNFYRINDDKYIVISGDMKGKKHDWIVYPNKDVGVQNSEKDIIISEKDIREYKDDKTRGNVRDIFDNVENVPIFYVQWQDSHGKSRISLGHTPMFRLAYEKTVFDHIYYPPIEASITEDESSMQPEYDLTEVVFGNEYDHAGRVFFEDAMLSEEDKDKVCEDIKIPMILSGPKPTSVQLYLEQKSDDIEVLESYNDSALIRGNKLYWHRNVDFEERKVSYDIGKKDLRKKIEKAIQNDGCDPKKYIKENSDKFDIELQGLPEKAKKIIIETIRPLSEAKKDEKQHTIISPISVGAKFKGTIRFENLSDIELGALLFSINIKDGLCHKLGMGKPLGLGSVKMYGRVHLSDRRRRYEDLFYEWRGVREANKIEVDKKMNAFEKYILSKVHNAGGKSLRTIWDLDRLRELEKMLNFDKKPSFKDTKYMPLEEFRDLGILPEPIKI